MDNPDGKGMGYIDSQSLNCMTARPRFIEQFCRGKLRCQEIPCVAPTPAGTYNREKKKVIYNINKNNAHIDTNRTPGLVVVRRYKI